MRVLVVTNLYPPHFIGGYELGCGQMVDALRMNGHQVTVLTATTPDAVPDETHVRRLLKAHELVFDAGRMSAANLRTRTLRQVEGNVIDAHNVAVVLQAIRDSDPDVVYLWNLTGIGGLGIAFALAQLQLPIVWHLMDAVPNHICTLDPGRPARPLARAMSRRLRAMYLCCSQRLADEIAAVGYQMGNHVRLVPNWVGDIAAREREFFPGRRGALKILSAGQLAPHKGVQHIIEACHILVRSGRTGFDVDIYGSGEHDHFARMILVHGLEARVTLGGPLTQAALLERYWDHDLFVFPTWRREPFAFAPLEAAGRGCLPVISEDCGNSEWMVHGLHCLKVAPRPDAIADLIASILDREFDVRTMACHARRVVTADFAIDRVLPQVEAAFQDAIRLPAVRPGTMTDAHRAAQLGEELAMQCFERV